MNKVKFKNAQEAFEHLYDFIMFFGEEVGNGTRSFYNCGFYIENPKDNFINTSWRKWNPKYADREWQWYLSKNRSVEELKKFAPIWDKMHNGNNIVNSNYGYQWSRNEQLTYVINELTRDNNSRKANISIYDGKEHPEYTHDTPCTLSIGFRIVHNKLNMSVIMRSNDLVYGFCNDQYCFSKLQQIVADELNKEIGTYYHFAQDMHIYESQYKLKK